MKSDYIVFIGRFQPFHKAHLKVCLNALKEAEQLIIVVGSYQTSISTKNPWIFEERKEMILSSLPKEVLSKVIIVPLRDFMYSDAAWKTSLQASVNLITGGNDNVKIIGHFKDDSSWYLKSFPQWKLIAQPNFFGLDATKIRTDLFENGNKYLSDESGLSDEVLSCIDEWAEKKSDLLEELKTDYAFIENYKKLWESAPFPPTFVTTDAIVIQAGHVLVVKRKINPGKGKFALPGGFINASEPIFRACIRELYEETNIELPKPIVRSSKFDERVFDHPYRSARGRTITHAYAFKLDDTKPLPKVKGGDDAAEAMWMPFSDVIINEPNFFEDHVHIINYFVNKV